MNLTIAALGDAADINCWSGIPFHFYQAARVAGISAVPCRIDLGALKSKRVIWNLGQLFRGSQGGFQYSSSCLSAGERQIPLELMGSEFITFNQHFPRFRSVARHGGILNHYLDAPFVALATGRGLDLQLPRHVVRRAIALERENYQGSKRVVVMARWAAEVLIQECEVPVDKVHVILPGANIMLPAGFEFTTPHGRPGIDRDFVLGFVGKDWVRKGLPLLCEVGSNLRRRGWKVRVLAAGPSVSDLALLDGVESVGFLDKSGANNKFVNFLQRCDVGCLFSGREALGISTLEFLRAGVPVAGFAHEGPADSIPSDAGFRFKLGSSVIEIADRVDAYLHDESEQQRFRHNASKWSERVTWHRCLKEFQELWGTGTILNPVQPWQGLSALK